MWRETERKILIDSVCVTDVSDWISAYKCKVHRFLHYHSIIKWKCCPSSTGNGESSSYKLPRALLCWILEILWQVVYHNNKLTILLIDPPAQTWEISKQRWEQVNNLQKHWVQESTVSLLHSQTQTHCRTVRSSIGTRERFSPLQLIWSLNTELSPFPPQGAGCASSRSGCLWRRPQLDRCRRGWPAARPTCAAATCPSGRWIFLSAVSSPAGLHSREALKGRAHPQMLVKIHRHPSNAQNPPRLRS